MIPKKIHYCWFGGNPLPELALKCIESWKKNCPDYEIVQWDESNYQTNNCYAKEALALKKWAFYSDYARLDIIYNHGGIYLDTDVQILRSLDELLQHESFFGLETTGFVATGLGFGAEKGNPVVKAMLDEYEGIHFVLPDGSYDTLPCPEKNTNPLRKMGLMCDSIEIQRFPKCTVFPPEYFCPLDYRTNILKTTQKTFSIHLYNSSWVPMDDMRMHRLQQILVRYLGETIGIPFSRFMTLPYRVVRKLKQLGLKGTLQFVAHKFRK